METININHYIATRSTVIKIAIPVLGLIGMGISSYLTYIHYRSINSVCLLASNCDLVLTSPYARVWGIPLSLFGLLMYACLTILGFLMLTNNIKRKNLIATGIYSLALSGTMFSIYLYYLEIFEIHAFCSWCIASSLVIFSLFALSLVNLKVNNLN